MTIISIVATEAGPRFQAQASARFVPKLVTRIHPLANASIALATAFGRLFQSAMSHLASTVAIERPLLTALWTDVFDIEFGVANDQLALLLHACCLAEAVGNRRILPLVAPRLARAWQLPAAVSANAQGAATRFCAALGALEWEFDLPSLVIALGQANAVLAAAAGGWVQQQHAAQFVITGMRRARGSLTPAHQLVVIDAAELMAANPRTEIRNVAVDVFSVLIPLCESESNFFELNVKGRKRPASIAAALALTIGLDVVNAIPPWAPAVFALLEAAKGQLPQWSEAIRDQLGLFWNALLGREVPELEPWRDAFTGGYFS